MLELFTFKLFSKIKIFFGVCRTRFPARYGTKSLRRASATAWPPAKRPLQWSTGRRRLSGQPASTGQCAASRVSSASPSRCHRHQCSLSLPCGGRPTCATCTRAASPTTAAKNTAPSSDSPLKTSRGCSTAPKSGFTGASRIVSSSLPSTVRCVSIVADGNNEIY